VNIVRRRNPALLARLITGYRRPWLKRLFPQSSSASRVFLREGPRLAFSIAAPNTGFRVQVYPENDSARSGCLCAGDLSPIGMGQYRGLDDQRQIASKHNAADIEEWKLWNFLTPFWRTL